MSYDVIFSSKSYKHIKSFDETLKERIKKAALEIGKNPWHKDCTYPRQKSVVISYILLFKAGL
jgi:mRNA-degrading endonuclease RelE of RelBE toxin-antitoxin system